MPLYEYRCRRCRRRFTKLFRSIATAGDPGPCPHCGGTEVDRLLSRIVVQRRHPERSEPLDRVEWSNEEPEASEFPTSWEDDEGGELPELPDTDDPRELARWTREMSALAGEPLDPALERALWDLERGEDPDRVLERLDEETLLADTAEEDGSSTLEQVD